jgi:stage III sporulation protein SpoIIIAA
LGDRLALLKRTAVGGRHSLLIARPPGGGKTTTLQEPGRRFAGIPHEGLASPRFIFGCIPPS